MGLSKSEREEAIDKLKESTTVAKYAFKEALKKNKITDEQLIKMVEHSEILAMLKPVVSINRQGQKKRTRAANLKTEESEKELSIFKEKLINFENSEIFKLGKWLMDMLKLSGEDRKIGLVGKNLVHIEDHQNDLGDLVRTLREHNEIANQQLSENEITIKSLENTIDNQKRIIKNLEDKIGRGKNQDEAS